MVETLEKYMNKGQFNQTPDRVAGGIAIGSGHSFVIHEHYARRKRARGERKTRQVSATLPSAHPAR